MITIDIEKIKSSSLLQLKEYAKELGLKGISKMKKDELGQYIEQHLKKELKTKETITRQSETEPVKCSGGDSFEKADTVPQKTNDTQTHSQQHELMPTRNIRGFLEVMPDGYGFLRGDNYLTTKSDDVYVNNAYIRKYRLKTGDMIDCVVRKAKKTENNDSLIYINSVNCDKPEVAARRHPFETLTPIYPNERIHLECENDDYALRLIDLMAPIGKGQRGMIVAPPKAGKTTILKSLANAISRNHPEINLIVLLIDERPEEVTDMKRSVNGEVIYSTFDEQPEHHIKVAELVLERAQRLVEQQKDVVVLLDSITRLARAYNLVVPSSGKTLTGGIDPASLHKPKKFFGAARNIENGGSLTILATALIDTGSRMDDVIFEEFKGTGNMEIHLDRGLSERRIFPAIDIYKSGTRKENLLLTKQELEAVWSIRKSLNSQNPQEAAEMLITGIIRTKNNAEFINSITRKTR